ncbi:MAG: M55 family metallopeptidase [Candidatus Aenigmatarchaeota archaeon]
MTYLFSVDIEGISGVVSGPQCKMDSKEYDRAQKLMTKEANAAAKGAFDAGAEHVYVTDGHGKMRNIIVEDLDERVELFSGRPKLLSQMEGLSEGLEGVGYIGYHSSAHSQGTLSHTYSGAVVDKLMIGETMASEFAMNSFLAARYDVPVFFLAGDDEIIREAKELYPEIPHVQTKKATGRYSAKCRHPKVVRKEIREKVKEAVENDMGKVIEPDDTLYHVWFKDAGKLDNIELLPSVERKGPKEFVIDTGDLETNYKVFRACTMLATVDSQ